MCIGLKKLAPLDTVVCSRWNSAVDVRKYVRTESTIAKSRSNPLDRCKKNIVGERAWYWKDKMQKNLVFLQRKWIRFAILSCWSSLQNDNVIITDNWNIVITDNCIEWLIKLAYLLSTFLQNFPKQNAWLEFQFVLAQNTAARLHVFEMNGRQEIPSIASDISTFAVDALFKRNDDVI